MHTTAPERARFIAALRDLSDFLAAHPNVPVPDDTKEILVFASDGTDVEERGSVDRAASALGVPIAEHSGHYTASCTFGSVLTYTVLTISSAARGRHEARMSYCDNIATSTPAAPAATAA